MRECECLYGWMMADLCMGVDEGGCRWVCGWGGV